MRGFLRRLRVRAALLALIAAGVAVAPAAPLHAQALAARVLITDPVDEARRVRLAGNTRSEANAHNDRGRVPDAMPLEHMLLLLKRPAERESELRNLVPQLHDRRSPEYHHWLSAAELGQWRSLTAQAGDRHLRGTRRRGVGAGAGRRQL